MRLADLALLNGERMARRPVAIITDLGDGGQRVVAGYALATDALHAVIAEQIRIGRGTVTQHEGRDVFIAVHVPPVRIIVVGAVHISQALATMAALVELDVTIVDPRTAFATPERFPGVTILADWPDDVLPRLALDAYTAIALLTHDPKIDDQALVAALRANCFYIGALGSRKTHARRLDRMREAGFGDDDLAPHSRADRAGYRRHQPGRDRRVHHRRDRRRASPQAEAGRDECRHGAGLKFGRIAVAAAEGALLAHSVKGPGLALRKGEVLDESHIARLEAAGFETIIGALLEAGDVHENVAALRLAEKIAGPSVRLDRPFTGRCNMFAQTAGLVVIDVTVIDAINAIDESVTVATLPRLQPVVAGEMIATVKIIPFAIPGSCMDQVLKTIRHPALSIAPFRPLRVGAISTLLRGLKPVTVTKTLRVLADRLSIAGASIVAEARVPHDVAALAAAIRVMSDVDLLIVFGASAITDRRDVVPVAIEMAGGRVDHLGMPVDPGNLLLLGRLADSTIR